LQYSGCTLTLKEGGSTPEIFQTRLHPFLLVTKSGRSTPSSQEESEMRGIKEKRADGDWSATPFQVVEPGLCSGALSGVPTCR